MPDDNIPIEGQPEPTPAPAPQEDARIPKQRFDQVNNALREFKELGLSPGDIREMVGEYRALVERMDTPAAASAPQGKIDEARRKELREGLLEVMPELGKLGGLFDEVEQTKVTATTAQRQQLEAMNTRSSDLCQSLFAEHGFDVAKQQKLYDRLETGIANEIYADTEKRLRFFRGDLDVVRETFKEHADDLLAHVVKPAKQPTKDLSFMSNKRGLSLPASPLDEKIKGGKPLTREEMGQMFRDTYSHMQSQDN
jgi:hypothetical protein